MHVHQEWKQQAIWLAQFENWKHPITDVSSDMDQHFVTLEIFSILSHSNCFF